MLLDTSGLLCYLAPADSRHAAAGEYLDAATSLLLHNYIVAELIAFCRSRRLHDLDVLRFVRELAQDPRARFVWVDTPLHNEALRLLEDRPDKRYSLCDAVSFVLMREHNVAEALTTDHHFEQEGFVRLLPG
jgi:predicted nucleic acid-binding protein